LPSATLPASPAPTGTTQRLFVFYHYLFPDNVVSAIHMDQLCQWARD
jgi:hypothetical protein